MYIHCPERQPNAIWNIVFYDVNIGVAGGKAWKYECWNRSASLFKFKKNRQFLNVILCVTLLFLNLNVSYLFKMFANNFLIIFKIFANNFSKSNWCTFLNFWFFSYMFAFFIDGFKKLNTVSLLEQEKPMKKKMEKQYFWN